MQNDLKVKYKVVEIGESTLYQNDQDFDDPEAKEDYYFGNGIFEGDPDMVYVDGQMIGYVFIDDTNHEVFGSIDDDAGEVLELVADWASKTSKLNRWDKNALEYKELEGGWDAVKRKGITLAYRGGAGYSYGIWALK